MKRRCKRVGNEPGYGSPDDDRMIHGTTPRSDTCPGAGSGLRATAMKWSVTPRGTLILLHGNPIRDHCRIDLILGIGVGNMY